MKRLSRIGGKIITLFKGNKGALKEILISEMKRDKWWGMPAIGTQFF